MDRPPGQYDVAERLLEVPYRVVHGPEREQRQRVDPDHDGDEGDVEDDLDQAHYELGVEQEHRLVVPRHLAVQVHRVQGVLDGNVDDDGEEDGVLRLTPADGGALRDGRLRKTAASSAKSKEKRLQRKEEQQRISQAMAAVAEANKLKDPLEPFPVFQEVQQERHRV
ncbi:hypothetical protein NQ318_017568 [Aromia moschata]|uniref:Uncharacterized protein n=1 Tax=Aromia moschata TaxID=1265417 RepID=A0AAV8Z2C0_9CUCU|nr:hypothetical protein NQ318_017568 [Aromia moschata]